MKRQLSDYAVGDAVRSEPYYKAEIALHNALGCDAYPEELAAAARAAERLADQASALARRLREAGR